MTWVEATDIIIMNGLKPKHFNIETDTELQNMINKWLLQCESLIMGYTKRKTWDNPPEAVKNICMRLCSNMVTLAVQRRDNPIIKVDDWNIRTVSSNIFSNDLKEDLKPYILDSSNSEMIGVLAVTGKDLKK